MELSQMIQFKAVVECENISRAAEKLYLSQPAVSKSLHRIEEELGIKLFLRVGNKLVLQPAGRIVLSHVEKVLDELSKMEEELTQPSSGKTMIRIASPSTAILRYYVPNFLNSRSDIVAPASVREQEELEKLILNQEVDVAFTAQPFLNPAICSMLFEEEYLMVSVPIKHPLAALDSLHIKDLNGHAILMKPSRGLLQKRQDELIAREKVKLQIVHQEDYLIYREIAKSTNLPYFTSSIAQHFYEPVAQSRKNIPVLDPEVHLTYYIALHVDNFSNAFPFIDWLFKNRICRTEIAE